MKHSHYFKDVSKFDTIDVYRVLELFEVADPCLQHAIKKLLVAGGRGNKDISQDVREAIDSLERWSAMRKEETPLDQIEIPGLQHSPIPLPSFESLMNAVDPSEAAFQWFTVARAWNGGEEKAFTQIVRHLLKALEIKLGHCGKLIDEAVKAEIEADFLDRISRGLRRECLLNTPVHVVTFHRIAESVMTEVPSVDVQGHA